MLVLLVTSLASLATSTTLDDPVTFTCPVDQTGLNVRLAKTRLVPAMDAQLTRGRVGLTHECPRCHWVGHDSDVRAAVRYPAKQRALVAAWLGQQKPMVSASARHARSARIAAMTGSPEEAAHRFLQAAAATTARAPGYEALRLEARDQFLKVNTAVAAYAAAELTRQSGDRARAETLFSELLAREDASDRLKTWATAALARR